MDAPNRFILNCVWGTTIVAAVLTMVVAEWLFRAKYLERLLKVSEQFAKQRPKF